MMWLDRHRSGTRTMIWQDVAATIPHQQVGWFQSTAMGKTLADIRKMSMVGKLYITTCRKTGMEHRQWKEK